MQKVVLDSELARLEAIRSAWRSAQVQAAWQGEAFRSRLSELEKSLAAFEAAIRVRDAYTTPKFKITLRRNAFGDDLEIVTDRETAGKRIRSLAAAMAMRILAERAESLSIGHYKGFDLNVAVSRSPTTGDVIPQVYLQVSSRLLSVNIGESDTGIQMSLEAKLRSFDTEVEHARQEIRVTAAKLSSLEEELNRPWEHEAKHAALNAQADELARELDASGAKASPSLEVPRSSESNRDDSLAEVRAALAAIEALHADPEVLERFGGVPEGPALEISHEGLKKLEEEIQEKQTLLAFGQAILQSMPQGETFQLTLFGEVLPLEQVPYKRKRRR
jgi:hypothetical protein